MRRQVAHQQKKRLASRLALPKKLPGPGRHRLVMLHGTGGLPRAKILETIRIPRRGLQLVRRPPPPQPRHLRPVHVAAGLSKTITASGVVMHLAAEKRLVARRLQHPRQRGRIRRRPAVVVPRPDARDIFARGKGLPRRHAQRRVAIAVLKHHPSRRQAIQIRRAHNRVAVAPQHGCVVLIAHDNQNVRRLRPLGGRAAGALARRQQQQHPRPSHPAEPPARELAAVPESRR